MSDKGVPRFRSPHARVGPAFHDTSPDGRPQTVGVELIPKITRRFVENHPSVSVKLVVDTTRTISRAVATGELDAALVGGVVPQSMVELGQVVVEPYLEDQMVLICCPDDPVWSMGPVSLSQLARMRFVSINKSSTVYARQAQVLRQHGIDMAGLTVMFEVNSVEAVKNAVEEGLGVAFISASAVERELKLGLVRVVNLGDVSLVRELLLVTNPQRYMSTATRAFLAQMWTTREIFQSDAANSVRPGASQAAANGSAAPASTNVARIVEEAHWYLDDAGDDGPESTAARAASTSTSTSTSASASPAPRARVLPRQRALDRPLEIQALRPESEQISGQALLASMDESRRRSGAASSSAAISLREELRGRQGALAALRSAPRSSTERSRERFESLPLSLEQLRTLRVCAAHKALNAAAAELGVSPAFVTQTIQAVEEALGCRVLVRNGRETSGPTVEGQELVASAERIAQLCDEALGAIQDAERGALGDVFLGASQTTGTYLMPRLLSIFRARHPSVSVRMTVDKSSQICEMVARGDVDAGIIGGEVPRALESRVTKTTYSEDEMVLIVARNHPFAGRGVVDTHELQGLDFITLSEESSVYEAQERQLAVAGIQWEDLRVSMQLNSVDAIKNAVQHELGIAFVSLAAVEKEISMGLLSKVRLRGVRMARKLLLITSNHGHHSRAAQAFMQEIFKVALEVPLDGSDIDVPVLRAVSARPWEVAPRARTDEDEEDEEEETEEDEAEKEREEEEEEWKEEEEEEEEEARGGVGDDVDHAGTEERGVFDAVVAERRSVHAAAAALRARLEEGSGPADDRRAGPPLARRRR